MKAARILAVAVLASIPALSFADTGHDLTRADVRAELVRLEKAGYSPASSEAHYTDDIVVDRTPSRPRSRSRSRSRVPTGTARRNPRTTCFARPTKSIVRSRAATIRGRSRACR